MKKPAAQLDREIAKVLAGRAAERRNPSTASGIVQKLRGTANRLIGRQRDAGELRDPNRTIARLSDLASQAVSAAEHAIATGRLAPAVADLWADRFADARMRVSNHVADLQELRADPAGYAASSRQRFGTDTSPSLATALYYSSALDDLARALRRFEAMTS